MYLKSPKMQFIHNKTYSKRYFGVGNFNVYIFSMSNCTVNVKFNNMLHITVKYCAVIFKGKSNLRGM